MNFKNYYIKRTGYKGKPSNFFMRFYNPLSSDVLVSLNNLVSSSASGNPFIDTAVIERSGSVITDVKSGPRNLTTFSIAPGESCVFRMVWYGGLFGLMGGSTYQQVVTSAGCKLSGDYDTPFTFMYNLFNDCVNYNQQPGDVFDFTELNPTNIGGFFMCGAWYGCTSLTTAVIPDTSTWNVRSIEGQFLYNTWGGCTSLISGNMIDTTNWNVNMIGDGFIRNAWYGCSSLTTCNVPNTTNWNVTSVGGMFLYDTWGNNCFSATGTAQLTLRGGLYVQFPLSSNSGNITNSRIGNIRVDSGRIGQYQTSPSWSNITPSSKFISW